MERCIDHLAGEGMARRQGLRVVFARDLLNTLRRRELDAVAAKLAAESGLAHRHSSEGEYVAGTFRQRVVLASGRFAMIDDGLGFPLVPWRPALEQHLGRASPASSCRAAVFLAHRADCPSHDRKVSRSGAFLGHSRCRCGGSLWAHRMASRKAGWSA
jgi:hypothetical protein